MNLKTIRFYMVVALLIVGYFAYASYNGIVYLESTVEKNIDTNNSSSHSSGSRFYHK